MNKAILDAIENRLTTNNYDATRGITDDQIREFSDDQVCRSATPCLVLSDCIFAAAMTLLGIYASRTKLIEAGALAHPIAIESIVPVFPLLIFAISLLVTFWKTLWLSAASIPYPARLRAVAGRASGRYPRDGGARTSQS